MKQDNAFLVRYCQVILKAPIPTRSVKTRIKPAQYLDGCPLGTVYTASVNNLNHLYCIKQSLVKFEYSSMIYAYIFLKRKWIRQKQKCYKWLLLLCKSIIFDKLTFAKCVNNQTFATNITWNHESWSDFSQFILRGQDYLDTYKDYWIIIIYLGWMRKAVTSSWFINKSHIFVSYSYWIKTDQKYFKYFRSF